MAFIASRYLGWDDDGGGPSKAPPDDIKSETVDTTLRRGPFSVFHFIPRKSPPPALLIFGSGDGGWSHWEERFCRAMQIRGYEVIGIDFGHYASKDYDLDTLQADYGTLINSFRKADSRDIPVILSGYSMGAEQAVAVAGGPHIPAGVAGLLLISPGSRARYGLRGMDKLDIPPSGTGTYGLKDFGPAIHVPVVQWHAEFDPTDSTSWLKSLAGPQDLQVYPMSWHDYQSADPDFLKKAGDSLTWILDHRTQTNGKAAEQGT